MKLIADNAFDNLIVHRLYLANNRLRKFPQLLFEPILSQMAKINIEQKIFYGETELNRGGLVDFSDVTYRNAVVNRAVNKSSNQTRNVSSGNSLSKQASNSARVIGNLVHEQKNVSSSGDSLLGMHVNQLRNYFTSVYRKYLKFLSSNASLANHSIDKQSRNESSQSNSSLNLPFDELYPNDFDEELNILIRLDLSADLLEQLIYDSMLNNLNFTRFGQLNERLTERKRRSKSNRNANDSLSNDELDSLFYSQLFDWQAETQADDRTIADHRATPNLAKQNDQSVEHFLASSNSFREEIRVGNGSSVFFDDEPNQNFDFTRPSADEHAHPNLEGDQNAAFVDVLGKRIVLNLNCPSS